MSAAGLEPPALRPPHSCQAPAAAPDLLSEGWALESLPRQVLARRSMVKLLPSEVELSEEGANAIFPELQDTMARIQREVTTRLTAMMKEASAQ